MIMLQSAQAVGMEKEAHNMPHNMPTTAAVLYKKANHEWDIRDEIDTTLIYNHFTQVFIL